MAMQISIKLQYLLLLYKYSNFKQNYITISHNFKWKASYQKQFPPLIDRSYMTRCVSLHEIIHQTEFKNTPIY